MRTLHHAVAFTVALGLIAGCTGTSAQTLPSPPPSPSESLPAATTPAPPTPDPPPTERPEPKPPPPSLSVVRLRTVKAFGTNNQKLLGGQSPSVSVRTARKAATKTARVLERYLDAQFVRERTRFSNKPLRKLLTRSAERQLRRGQRRALGMLTLRPGRIDSRKVTAHAFVLMDEGRADAVTLSYRARFTLTTRQGKRRPLHQEGALLFHRGDNGWRVGAADVELDVKDRKRPRGQARGRPDKKQRQQRKDQRNKKGGDR